MSRLMLCLSLAAGLPLAAQVGYPGGGYPPGRYPGGGGIPLPWPRRGKTAPTGPDSPAERIQSYSGTLRRIDSKSLVIEDADHQSLEFRFSKTKFYRDSDEIEASQLKAGDRLSVDARQDRNGYLYAVTVRVEQAAAADTAAPEVKTEPTLMPGDDDPDRPRLRRGIPEQREGHADADEPAAPPPAPSPADPLIAKAREAAASFGDKLPNYVTTEYMARYESTARPADWHALDVVSTEVVYENGKERYRNVQVNGRATKQPLEQIGGSWSTGEFGSILLDLFSPATGARFDFDRESMASGLAARVYRFEVQQPHSHWHVQAPAQTINPAYKGSVWIDPKTGRALRIEMQARRLPESFPLDTVETAVDYAPVRIGAGEFLLPVHSESLSCERGTPNCSRNTIDFRNYHKYDADSSVTFDSATR